MTKMNCPFCNQEIETWPLDNSTHRSCECPCCGWFILRDFPQMDVALLRNETAAFFYYTGNKTFLKKDTVRINYVGSKEYFETEDFQHSYPNAHFITKEEIQAFYPRTFTEQITRILLGLAQQVKFLGNRIFLTRDEIISAFFIKRFDDNGEPIKEGLIRAQLGTIQNYLIDNGYVELGTHEENRFPLYLTPKGWSRIDELLISDTNNRNVFVAMSFRDENRETREAVRAGIVQAGYSPEIMDEIIHNQQIVPEMFRLIREAKLLVLEISDPNYGSYLEAGYAMALGKGVIVCCKQEVFDKKYITEEEKKYERFLKPHFDIVQRQILKWNDTDDLTKKLSEWIKAIAG